MRKKKRLLFIVIASILSLFIGIYLYVMYHANLLITIDNFINGDREVSENPYLETPSEGIEEPDNGYFNSYHKKACEIDLTKIDKMIEEGFSLDIPEELWNLKQGFSEPDITGEIELYRLICEILTRPEINPIDSNYKIKPNYVYGSWFNESSLIRGTEKPFDPYTQLIPKKDSMFAGPFSLSVDYSKQSIGIYEDARMYVYIPEKENENVATENRVMRILNYELYHAVPSFTNIIGSSYKPLVDSVQYANDIRSNIRFDENRPNPQVASDAIYTFCRKLRTASLSKNVYTLNDSYVESNQNLNSLYKQYVTVDNAGQKYSDLCFLFGVQLNSGQISMHFWNDNLEPDSDMTGTMPYIYIKMLERYGTLDATKIQGFSGWRDQQNLDEFITGKQKGRQHLADTPVTNENSIVSSIGAREYFDRAISDLKGKKNGTEYSWTSSYGLECIANGSMISGGVELAIQSVYEYQLEHGYLNISSDIETSLGSTLSGDVVTRYFGEAGKNIRLHLPWSDSVPVKRYITHNFLCSENYYYCIYHTQFSHSGIDLIFYSKETSANTLVDICAFADGTIQRVSKYSESGYSSIYGNAVWISHTIGDSEFVSVYGHMQTAGFVFSPSDVGKKITAGTVLGKEGTTGKSTGNHLHFGFYKKNGSTNVWYDPEPLLREMRHSFEADSDIPDDSFYEYETAYKTNQLYNQTQQVKLARRLRGIE